MEEADYFLEGVGVEVSVTGTFNDQTICVKKLEFKICLEYEMGPLDLPQADETSQKTFRIIHKRPLYIFGAEKITDSLDRLANLNGGAFNYLLC